MTNPNKRILSQFTAFICIVGAAVFSLSATMSAAANIDAPPPPEISAQEGALCAADVKLCPRGGSVSRNLAKACAFDPCPGEAAH